MVRLLFTLFLACFAVVGHAQDRSRAILVLDASGSMWGQIDGINKITIAQEVIGGLLQTMPAEQELGLTVYGHRRKGDCGDIETLIQPGGDKRAEIAAAVNAIKPKGKTPLSAAVIAAAEALKYTEDRATVILVSDGRETCDFDPCEVGRKLEEAGVDFTAHVIGFDVDDPADRAQLQCLAEETGGTFRTASNAGELADALSVVAEPPAPASYDLTLRAIAGAGGREIVHGLRWKVTDSAGAVLLDSAEANAPRLNLPRGAYTALVSREKDGAEVSQGFVVETPDQTVTVVLPELPPEPRTVHYRGQEGAGGPLIGDPLVWDIFREDGSAVVEANVAAQGTVQLLPGTYRIEALRPEDEAVATTVFKVDNSNQTVTVVLPELVLLATISGPETGVAGSLVQVEWTGPAGKNDFISVAPVGSKDATWSEYTYTKEGNVLTLLLPPTGGAYELRYVRGEGRKVLARQAIQVSPVVATITPPTELPVGATVQVNWTGPDYQNDFLAVVPVGADKWINYTYTKEGMPSGLKMPGEAGDYEIVYFMSQKRTIIARVPITVTDVSFAVTGPDSAVAGSTIDVDWVGPGYIDDYLAIAEVGADDATYVNYSYTKHGNPGQLLVPLAPGAYELRYVLGQDRAVMARAPLIATEVTASLSGPTSGNAGAEIAVTWDGPGYQNDYVTIASPDQAATKYAHYTYTKEGSPLQLQLPSEPGTYELRYIAGDGGGMVLARQSFTVNPVQATVAANATAAPGSDLTVTWQGPGYQTDYITISRVDDPTGYESYTYVRKGASLSVKVPDTPGAYEVRYVLGQDRVVLHRVPLTVE